jgi:hypothetical protein
MDANKMKSELLQRVDIITNFSTPGLTDLEIASILTESEFHFVENLLPIKDFTESIRRQLSTLYKPLTLVRANDVSNDQDGTYSLGEYWNIPEDIFHILSEQVKITSNKACLNETFIGVKPITYDEYNSNIKNPFKNPDKNTIWKLESKNNTVELIKFVDVTEITHYKLVYIKKPIGIIPFTEVVSGGDGTTNSLVNSIMPDITHEKIVNIAVTKTLKYLGLFPELQADLAMGEQLK